MFIVIFYDFETEDLTYCPCNTYEEAKKLYDSCLDDHVFNKAEIIDVKKEFSLQKGKTMEETIYIVHYPDWTNAAVYHKEENAIKDVEEYNRNQDSYSKARYGEATYEAVWFDD